MLGLILKDLLNLRKDLKIYALFIAFYVAITFVSESTNILMATIAIMCVMIPLSAMAHDEKVNWDKFCLTMPVSYKDIVLSKYVTGVGTATLGFIITTILSLIDNGLVENYLELPITFWAISIVMLSILLPIFIKFGSEKGGVIVINTLTKGI